MGNKKGLFTMTRHERAGAVAVLVLLVMAICVHAGISHRNVSHEAIDTVAIQAFEHRCDSLEAVKASKPKKRLKEKAGTGSSPKGAPKKAQKAPSNGHHMEQVPVF